MENKMIEIVIILISNNMPIFLETIVLAYGRKWMWVCKTTKKAECG
jgi:hypothetical protein